MSNHQLVNYFTHHPRDIFSWIELGAEGLKHTTHIDRKILNLTIHIANTFQDHLDMASACASFKLENPSYFVAFCEALYSAILIVNRVYHLSLKKEFIHFVKVCDITFNLIQDSSFVIKGEWKKMNDKKFYFSTIQLITSIACSILAAYSLFAKKENPYPILSMGLNSIYLSSKICINCYSNN